jgi:hypothetical protein
VRWQRGKKLHALISGEEHMRGRLGRRFAAAFMSGLIAAAMGVTLAATAAAAPIPVQDPVPIGPNEYFSGYINNHPPGKAVIKVVCPGPGTTGHPAASQKIEVKTPQPTSTFDIGFTGSAGKKITATLAPAATTTILASFTSFFVPKKIPTSIIVPCSGTGTVVFAPSPVSSTAKSAKLPVTFLNIGT